jgi:tyrosyl-tRNA synthetase
MQVADIFSMGVNIPHGGMDQRKAHVIAIEVGEKLFGYKPVAIHHRLLPGLQMTKEDWEKLSEAKRSGVEKFREVSANIKMSKSKPETAIFIHDPEEEIREKIRSAFCPPGEAEFNPVLELSRLIIFRDRREGFEVVNRKTGERRMFESYPQLEEAYRRREVHPLDLKEAVADELARILEPARRVFLEGHGRTLLEELRELRITR